MESFECIAASSSDMTPRKTKTSLLLVPCSGFSFRASARRYAFYPGAGRGCFMFFMSTIPMARSISTSLGIWLTKESGLTSGNARPRAADPVGAGKDGALNPTRGLRARGVDCPFRLFCFCVFSDTAPTQRSRNSGAVSARGLVIPTRCIAQPSARRRRATGTDADRR